MNQNDILDFLSKDRRFHSTNEMREIFKTSQSHLFSKLASLQKYGLIEKEKRRIGRSGYMDYWRAVSDR